MEMDMEWISLHAFIVHAPPSSNGLLNTHHSPLHDRVKSVFFLMAVCCSIEDLWKPSLFQTIPSLVLIDWWPFLWQGLEYWTGHAWDCSFLWTSFRMSLLVPFNFQKQKMLESCKSRVFLYPARSAHPRLYETLPLHSVLRPGSAGWPHISWQVVKHRTRALGRLKVSCSASLGA